MARWNACPLEGKSAHHGETNQHTQGEVRCFMTVHDPAYYKKFSFQDLLVFTENEKGGFAILRVSAAVFPNAVILDIAGHKIEIALAGAEDLLFGDTLFCILKLEPAVSLTAIPWVNLFADPARDPALLGAKDAYQQRLSETIAKVRESADRIQAARAAGSVTDALISEGRALADEVGKVLAGNQAVNLVQVRRIAQSYSSPQYYDLGLRGPAGASLTTSAFVDPGSDKSLMSQSYKIRLGLRDGGTPTRLTGAVNALANRADVQFILKNGQSNTVDVVVLPDQVIHGAFGRDFVIGREIDRWAKEHGEVI